MNSKSRQIELFFINICIHHLKKHVHVINKKDLKFNSIFFIFSNVEEEFSFIIYL